MSVVLVGRIARVDLERLDVSSCFQLVERALAAVGGTCRALRKLNASACPNLSRCAICAIVRGCPRLSSLNLSGVRQCDDRALAEIARYARSLRKLRVADCELVSDAGLRSLAGSGRAHLLELLDLSRCARVSDEGIIALVDGFSGLEQRQVDRQRGEDEDEDDLDRYRRTPALAHLLLAGCPLVTQNTVVRLAASCPLLLTLSLQVRQTSHPLVLFLASLTQVRGRDVECRRDYCGP